MSFRLRALRTIPQIKCQRHLKSLNLSRYNSSTSLFRNMLTSDKPPPIQIQSLTAEQGLTLADGLVIPGACIFLEGKVFLWDVSLSTSTGGWGAWKKECFEIFEVIKPRPDMLVLGTGESISVPPPFVRAYLNSLGIQLDVMSTRNACSTYNLLAEEGRRVAAAILPLKPENAWTRQQG